MRSRSSGGRQGGTSTRSLKKAASPLSRPFFPMRRCMAADAWQPTSMIVVILHYQKRSGSDLVSCSVFSLIRKAILHPDLVESQSSLWPPIRRLKGEEED